MSYETASLTWQRAEMAPGRLFFSRTWATHLVMATEVRGVVGAPYTKLIYGVIPYTAHGAQITPLPFL